MAVPQIRAWFNSARFWVTGADRLTGYFGHGHSSPTHAVLVMIDQGISCLPVLVDGTLVGIVTNTDLHVLLQLLLQTAFHSPLEEPVAAAVPSLQE